MVPQCAWSACTIHMQDVRRKMGYMSLMPMLMDSIKLDVFHYPSTFHNGEGYGCML